MLFNDVVDLIVELWKEDATQSVLLLGPPGIGKSAVGRAVANRLGEGAFFNCLDLTSMLPEDLGGLPYREGDEARYAMQPWMVEAQSSTRGVLMLDDLPAASPAVAVACRQLVLDRKLHEARLPAGVGVLVTGNRRQDKAGASDLPSHFRNAVLTLTIEPEVQAWTNWYAQQGDHLPKEIPAFLAWKPSHLSTTPDKADQHGQFATPRSWAMLARALAKSNKVAPLAMGLVGEGAAHEYMAFCSSYQDLVPIAALYDNPRQALPDPSVLSSPDKIISVCSGLGIHTCQLYRQQKSEEVVMKFFQAMAWVSSTNREYIAHGLETVNSTIPIMALTRVMMRLGDDPEMSALVEYFKRANA